MGKSLQLWTGTNWSTEWTGFSTDTHLLSYAWNDLGLSAHPFCYPQYFGLSHFLKSQHIILDRTTSWNLWHSPQRHLSNKNNKPTASYYCSCWSEIRKRLMTSWWVFDANVSLTWVWLSTGTAGQITSFGIMKTLKHSSGHGICLLSLLIGTHLPNKHLETTRRDHSKQLILIEISNYIKAIALDSAKNFHRWKGGGSPMSSGISSEIQYTTTCTILVLCKLMHAYEHEDRSGEICTDTKSILCFSNT